MSEPLRTYGVMRVADNPLTLSVAFRRRPTDDEMRHIHDMLRDLGVSQWLIDAAMALDARMTEFDGEVGCCVEYFEAFWDACAAYRKVSKL